MEIKNIADKDLGKVKVVNVKTFEELSTKIFELVDAEKNGEEIVKINIG